MSSTQMFGSWVKRRRKVLDLTQLELARLIGCSESAMIKIELGQRRPSRQIAERLVECLHIAPDEEQEFLSLARAAPNSGLAQPSTHIKSTTASVPNNLPALVTSLVGRESEIKKVTEYLSRGPRLVTLVGPGGIGKTRLGLEVAARLLPSFQDGVFFVPLAPIRDKDLLASTVAQSVGVREAAGRPVLDTVKGYLRDREILLLLDNFEQVLEAGPLVSELLASAPRLKIVVTSRTMLHLYGEQQFVVPP